MFYRILKAVVRPVFYFLFRVRVIGGEDVSFDQGMVMIFNHQSNLDPILSHLVVPRKKLYLMAKQELFRNPFLRWLITRFGAFPVNRGAGDLGAIKTAFKIVRRGDILGIYPEGTRSKDGRIAPFQHGVAMIATRLQVPVLPVYFSRKLRPFRRCYVVLGTPIDLKARLDPALSDTESMRSASRLLRDEMIALSEKVPR